MFNIADFSATFSQNGGGQRTTAFSVEIPIPNGLQSMASAIGSPFFQNTGRLLTMYGESTNLPGMQLATSTIHRYGYGSVEDKPFVPVFTSCNIRLIADGQGNIWNYMIAWLKFICNYDARNGMNTATGFGVTNNSNGLGGSASPSQFPAELNYIQDYAVDIIITMYDPTGKPTITTTLQEAFPKFIGDVQLNWGDMNNLMRIPVSFSFKNWYSNILFGGDNTNFATSANPFVTSSTTMGTTTVNQ